MSRINTISIPRWETKTLRFFKKDIPLKIIGPNNGVLSFWLDGYGAVEMTAEHVPKHAVFTVTYGSYINPNSTERLAASCLIGEGTILLTTWLVDTVQDISIQISVLDSCDIVDFLSNEGLYNVIRQTECKICNLLSTLDQLQMAGLDCARFVFPEGQINIPLNWFPADRIRLFKRTEKFRENNIVLDCDFSFNAILNMRKAVLECRQCEHGCACAFDDDLVEETIAAASFYYLEQAIRNLFAVMPAYKCVYYLSQTPLQDDCRFNDLREFYYQNYWPNLEAKDFRLLSADSLFLMFAKALNEPFVLKRLAARNPMVSLSGQKRSRETSEEKEQEEK